MSTYVMLLDTYLKTPQRILSLTILCSVSVFSYTHPVIPQAAIPLIFFSLCTVTGYYALRSYAALRFILPTFTLLISWRIASLHAAPLWLNGMFLIALVFVIITFVSFVYTDLTGGIIAENLGAHVMSPAQWQLLFIRMYIGFDLVPHFTEKLFAGPVVRMADVTAFSVLGVPNPHTMVCIAGMIEFLGALSLGCGALTRLGAIGLSSYLLIASYLGHHFQMGFIWASTGGGWEYPVLWALLIMSFAWFAPYPFSVDNFILRYQKSLPTLAKFIGIIDRYTPK